MLLLLECFTVGLRYVKKMVKYVFIIFILFVVTVMGRAGFQEYVKSKERPKPDMSALIEETTRRVLYKEENTFLGYDESKAPKGNREAFYGDEKKEPLTIAKIKKEFSQAVDYLSLNELVDSISKDPSPHNILINMLRETWKNGRQLFEDVQAWLKTVVH